MGTRQERVSFPMRALFTVFAFDVGAVAGFIRDRASLPSPVPSAVHYFELGMAAAAAAILGALVWMWLPLLRAIGNR